MLALIVPTSLLALDVPPRPVGYVTDTAHLLTESEKISLEEKLSNFEKETSNQIVLATFPSLEGDSLEDFSIRLAEGWKIGQKGKDNGVILLIIPNDRVLRIEVGYGLEGVIPDAYANQIIVNVLKPAFRKENYAAGLEKATDILMLAARGQYDEKMTSSQSDARVEFFKFLAVAGVFLFFGWLRQSYLPRGAYSYSRGGWSGSSWGSSSGGFSGGGGGSFGGGGSSGSW